MDEVAVPRLYIKQCEIEQRIGACAGGKKWFKALVEDVEVPIGGEDPDESAVSAPEEQRSGLRVRPEQAATYQTPRRCIQSQIIKNR